MLQQLSTSDNDDYIICQICGKKLKFINWSHLRQHAIDLNEYKNRFPDARTISKSFAKQMSDARLGKPLSEEHKQQLKAYHLTRTTPHAPFGGKHHSEETKRRISEKMLGNKSPLWGMPRSAETKRKIRESLKGKLAGKNNPNYGKKASKETKRKIRENHADVSGKNAPHWGKHLSAEHKRSISNALKGKLAGEKNPAWAGGTLFKPYCYKFNERKKQEIRDKYNNCDFISGLPAHICNPFRRLDVHHVNYNKMQGCDEHGWLLVPLSRRNHGITTKYRPFWRRLFIYTLNYDDDFNELDTPHNFIKGLI